MQGLWIPVLSSALWPHLSLLLEVETPGLLYGFGLLTHQHIRRGWKLLRGHFWIEISTHPSTIQTCVVTLTLMSCLLFHSHRCSILPKTEDMLSSIRVFPQTIDSEVQISRLYTHTHRNLLCGTDIFFYRRWFLNPCSSENQRRTQFSLDDKSLRINVREFPGGPVVKNPPAN